MRRVIANRRAKQLTIVTKWAKMVGDAQRRTVSHGTEYRNVCNNKMLKSFFILSTL
jgi:hypothetical protein